MSNMEMYDLIEKFKKYVRYTGKISPTTYQIAVEVLDIFYWWFAQEKKEN